MTVRPEPNVDTLRRSVIATLITLAGNEPYPDDPRWTPWTRFGERAAREVDDLAALARANTARDRLLYDAMDALEAAEREASVAHDAIWHKHVDAIPILHDDDLTESATASIWRLLDAVRPVLDRFRALTGADT